MITHQEAILYIDQKQVDKYVNSHLGNQVEVKPYESIFGDLKKFAEGISEKESVGTLCLHPFSD